MHDLDERAQPLRFVIHDRDSKFSAAFDEVFRTEGATAIETPVRAPNANASLDATLAVGQSWSLTDSWSSGPSGTGGTSLYINGTLSCYARATIQDDT